MQIFVTDAAAYRDALKEIGGAYRRHFGRHYPAMGLFEVAGLFDPEAKVELMCVAVVLSQLLPVITVNRSPSRARAISESECIIAISSRVSANV